VLTSGLNSPVAGASSPASNRPPLESTSKPITIAMLVRNEATIEHDGISESRRIMGRQSTGCSLASMAAACSLPSARASICRMRSFVTPMTAPTSLSVSGSSPRWRPKRRVTISRSR